MAIQTINIGTNPNDGTGDDLRTAFDKVNDNFAELLAVGGETNTASNLGIGEGVFKQKTAQNLEFKTLRNTDGKITITSDANSVYLNTSNLADNDFGSIQVDNGDIITATSSSATFGIKSGNTNIDVTKSGNDVVITGVFDVVNDTSPQLAGNLELLNNNIIGPGDLIAIDSISTTALDTDTLLVNTTSTFTGNAQFNGVLTAANGIIVPGGQTLQGTVNGNFQGSFSGAVNLNQQTLSGGARIEIDASLTNQSTPNVVGSPAGLSYRDYTLGIPPLTIQTNENRPVEFISRGQVDSIPQVPLVIEHVVDTVNFPVTQYNNGAGSGIQFAIDSTNPAQDRRLLGSLSAIKVSDPLNAVVITPYDPAQGFATPPKFIFQSDGFVQIDDIGIDGGSATISTLVSNKNLKLDSSGTGTVDFYGAYQFPRTIGNAGEVLTVPLSGTILEWGAGGGGGGGSSTFVGLSDTPASYAGSAADALKFVRVAASGTALEFVTLTSVVDSTYIDTNGGLLKAGGTMTGDINLGTNNITNGNAISATTFNGTLNGDVTGATNVTTTNLNVSEIDTTDSSEITVTPGVKLGSYLTVESSVNVLDTTTTKNLSVTNDATITGNANVNGTLTADNFQLSGSGAPSFSSGSDINFTAVGQLSTNASLVPTVDNSITLGTSSFKWSNVYATTFTGNLTGNVTGNANGDHTGTFNGTVGGVTPGIITGTVITANTNFAGPLTGDVTGNLSGTSIDVNYADIGNVRIESNSIETANSNENLRIASLGTGVIELDGKVNFAGTTAYSGNEDITVSGTATPVTLSVSNNISFITTSNWTAVGADFAYANLGAGTQDGQIKMIKMVNRGQFSTNGGATFTDRYLVVNLTINGAVSTLNVSQNSEYGAVTLVWHNSSWWILSQFDS